MSVKNHIRMDQIVFTSTRVCHDRSFQSRTCTEYNTVIKTGNQIQCSEIVNIEDWITVYRLVCVSGWFRAVLVWNRK